MIFGHRSTANRLQMPIGFRVVHVLVQSALVLRPRWFVYSMVAVECRRHQKLINLAQSMKQKIFTNIVWVIISEMALTSAVTSRSNNQDKKKA